MKINDMKCCGNCKYRMRQDIGLCHEEWCGKNTTVNPGSEEWCEDWEFDNINKKTRYIFPVLEEKGA